MRNSLRKAFTVIELVTVLAIVAILMAVLTPVVSNMMASARRSSDASNLRQLAMAYIAHISESGATKSVTFTNLDDWAVSLAKAGNFNEPALFLAQGDPAVTGTMPKRVVVTADTTDGEGNPIVAGSVDPIFHNTNLSVAAPQTVNLNGPAASTPIAWTRGLQSDGTWASTAPYGTKGGYVAFLDGHVSFYNKVPDTIDIPASTLHRP